jgi:transcriptional regulator with XRE-family HTH domain
VSTEKHPTSAILARRLKEIREDRRPRMTQADLARRLLEVMGVPTDDPKRVEVARVMVSRTESGARVATVDDLVWLAQALEVPPGALLEGSGGVDALSDLEERMRKMREDFSEFEASLRVNEKIRDLLERVAASSELQPEPLKEKKR